MAVEVRGNRADVLACLPSPSRHDCTGSRRSARSRAGRSKAGSRGEIDAEAISPALIAARHFGRGMAELLLHIAFIDLCRRGQACAQRMPGEFPLPFAFGKIAAHAGRERRRFDEARDVAGVQPVGADMPAAIDHAAKERPMRDARELQPGPERCDRAGEIERAAADFDFAPAGLAAQGDEQAFVEEFDPAGAVAGLIASEVEADDFRATEAAGETDEQDGGRSRRPRRSAGGSVASMARRSSGITASFCAGGRPCLRRMPASTVAIWRSVRSSGVPRCANCQAIADNRRSIVRTEAASAQAASQSPTVCGSGAASTPLRRQKLSKCRQSEA